MAVVRLPMALSISGSVFFGGAETATDQAQLQQFSVDSVGRYFGHIKRATQDERDDSRPSIRV
jgi:hypothetical protein